MESEKKPSIEEIKKQMALNKLNINFYQEHLIFIKKTKKKVKLISQKIYNLHYLNFLSKIGCSRHI